MVSFLVFKFVAADEVFAIGLIGKPSNQANDIRHMFSVLSAKIHKIGSMKHQILVLCLLLGQAVAQEKKSLVYHSSQQVKCVSKKSNVGQKVCEPRSLKGQKKPHPPKHRKEPLKSNTSQSMHYRLYRVYKHAKKSHLSMTEIKRILSAANAIRRQLELGPVMMIKTPQGKRLGVLLQYQGKTVAVAFVHSDGQLVKLRRSPLLSNSSSLPVLNLTARQNLKQQLSTTSLSGAIAVTPRYYRVLLMTEGMPVAILRLKQQDLKPIFKLRDLPKSK